MKPKALLMDLGNVTVRLRGSWWERLGAACQPPLSPAQLRQGLLEPGGPHHRYERGQIDGPTFHAQLGERVGLRLDYAAWLALWNDYFEPNRPLEALLARLRGQVRLWGLSNTNAQHLAHLRLNFRVLDTFEGLTASNEVGVAKPEPAIYQAALAGLGLEPAAVLFLDDVLAYVEVARGLGLQVFHYSYNDAQLRQRLLDLGFELPPLGGVSTTMGC